MSEKKHTPGPWEAFTQSSFSGWWSVRDSNGREIGSGDGGFEIADARLIASAPELLEFAEEVRRTGDTRLASMAIALIAKATP